MKNLICFDNNGESYDRFTILDKKTGEMIGASCEPFSPNGFGQHCGNVADNYWFTAYGYSWRKRTNVKKCTKFAIEHFLNDCSHIGKIIDFNSLPIDVQKFAKQSFE